MAPQQEIALHHKFRFIHEPLGTSVKNEWQRFIGRETELDELAARILLSDGGAFLVTGYRGVGKTTFVNRVVRRVEERLPQITALTGSTEIVSIYLNFARPMKATELMFHILRGLRLQLAERGLLHKLEPKVREELELAFMRTSLSMGYKASEQTERSFELGDLGLNIPYVGSKLKIGSKRTNGLSREYSYLAYDDKAAEYDLIQITRQLSKGYRVRRPFWRNLIGANSAAETRLKILFIFDELDKIEEDASPDGKSPIDEILGSLKNVFTTSGISFIFVAGRDTHERWLEDLGRGDSVYESIFTYARYLPALWAQVDDMCDGLLSDDQKNNPDHVDAMATYRSFKKFLGFKGRGIPRRIIRGFNDYVVWVGDKPCLRFSREHIRQFNFYAKLYDALVHSEEQLFGTYRDESPAQLDQQRLSVYYLVDWIFRSGLTEFTTDEVIAASRRLSRLIAPAEQVAPEMVKTLLQVLLRYDYLEEVEATQIAQEIGLAVNIAHAPKRYRVVPRRLAEMGRLTGIFDSEAKAVLDQPPPGIPTDRYKVVRLIGRGGMSNVYEAIDKTAGRSVAIKQMLPEFSHDESYRTRFKREAEILASLQHPNVVNVYDVGLMAEQIYIVMEYVEGVRLTDFIQQNRTRELSQFLTLAKDLLRAVQAIHDHNILWVDPKPGNIMITPEGRLVLLDFGISRLVDPGANSRQTMTMLGTPAYMSPEVVLEKPLDVRSDLYSIGVILFEMLAGRTPFESAQQVQIATKHAFEMPPPLSKFVTVPAEIEHVVMRCLEKDPADRFQSASEVLAALPDVKDVANIVVAAQEALATLAEGAAREDEATKTYTVARSPDEIPRTIMPKLELSVRAAAAGGTTVDSRSPWPPLPLAQPAGVAYQPQPSPAPTTIWPTVPLAPPAPQPVAPYIADCLTFEGQSGNSYTLKPGRNTLGRSAASDLILDEPKASRYHAFIFKNDLGCTIEDLNTINGTYVNHALTTEPRLLKDGDRIQIGKTVLRYSGPQR